MQVAVQESLHAVVVEELLEPPTFTLIQRLLQSIIQVAVHFSAQYPLQNPVQTSRHPLLYVSLAFLLSSHFSKVVS